MDKYMGGWINRWVQWIDGQMGRWVMDKSMNGGLNGCVDGWMDG